ncbi:hypothetical protein [Peptostreptococcus sp. D1]|uniref:hypothetical protein n=1 Tax=Peptostreptococcus sp. D1 TaxID=72304 RepID=UPI0008E3F686|nr:hypothetical protein [Peptostreptococcus sp. D1]SFE89473.1 hypothetical protein SAMN02910278_01985 [Peptostreptococcus sp. D1]
MNKEIEKYINEKVEQFKNELIKSIEDKEKEKTKTVWDLKEGDNYYFLAINGRIDSYTFNHRGFDTAARELGNIFLTREEAEFEVERRKIETVMRKYSRPFKNIGSNYFIYYIHSWSKILITTTYINAGYYYFDSKEAAQQVIDEIGEDRLKKYWFKVVE